MSTWVRARNAGQQVAAAIFQLLGKCRAMARAKGHAARLAGAGQDLKAQALQHRIAKQGTGGYLTQKDRKARAKALLAERAARQAKAAAPAARTTATIRAEMEAKLAAQGRKAPAVKPPPSPARAAAMARQVATSKAAGAQRGINAAFKASATPADIKAAAQQRLAGREGMNRLRIAQGKARVGDYVQAPAGGLNVRRPGIAEGHVIAKSADGNVLTIKRGDGKTFKVSTSMASPVGTGQRRFTPERGAKAAELAATRAAKAPAKPAAAASGLDLASVQHAANSVPSNLRLGNKVLLHHAWAAYREQTGHKIGLGAFKQQLADSPDARLKLGIGRHDMPGTLRPGDAKASSVKSGTAEFNHLRVTAQGSGEALRRRDLPKRAPAAERGAAAAAVARARGKRAPAKGKTVGEQVDERTRDARAAAKPTRSPTLPRRTVGRAEDMLARLKDAAAIDAGANPQFSRYAKPIKTLEGYIKRGGKPAKPKPTEHATIGHKPGEKFGLIQRPAVRASAGIENLGRGSTKFMFDMKKGDKPGQTSMFDKPEAAPRPARPAKTARERYNQASRILTRIPEHRLELATRTGTPTSKLYGKNVQVGARETQLKASRAHAADVMNRSIGAIAREKAKGETVSTQKSRMAAAVRAVAKLQKAPKTSNIPAMIARANAEGHKARAAGDLVGAHQWNQHRAALIAHKHGTEYQKQGGWNLSPPSERAAAAAVVAKARAAGKPTAKPAEKAYQAPRRLTAREALAKSRASTAEKIKGYRQEHLEQAQPHKYGKPGKSYTMGTKHIDFDPERFQYKVSAQGKHGVTEALGDVKHWDEDLAGRISVWKDPADGKTYVVNGHHRLDLAKKLGVKDINVKYLDAPTAEAARAKGALTNIAEGRGTATDAAQFFRDAQMTPEHLAKKGVSLRESVSKQGLALAQLHKSIFDRVVTGEMSQNRGAIVGAAGLSHEQQHALLKVLDKPGNRDLSDAVISRMAKRAGSAGSRKKEVKTLFGNDEHEESLYVHQAKLESSIMNELRDDATLFNRVSKSKAAEKIGERGGASKIDLEATGAQAEESARVHQLFDQLIDRHPTISRAFKRGAERIADGESKAVVQRETHEEVSNALKDFLSGKADPFAA